MPRWVVPMAGGLPFALFWFFAAAAGAGRAQSRRSAFGQVVHTGTPQKCVPSVQRGETIRLRSTHGGPRNRPSWGWTAWRGWTSMPAATLPSGRWSVSVAVNWVA